ncbi:MAG: hypothetical protein OXC82_09580 [Rhodobacteraceae bacterium]|nr:hypothetical protein [Paracoccaceae bacterium]MCY4250666.1 hypothetical protein [Paracoccaceae bacterium]
MVENNKYDIGPVSKEVAEWLSTIRRMWFEKLNYDEIVKCNPPDDFPPLVRIAISSIGSFFYIFGITVLILSIRNLPTIDNWAGWIITIILFPVAILGIFVGWLPKRAGPIRLFLSGFALTAVIFFSIATGVKYFPS